MEQAKAVPPGEYLSNRDALQDSSSCLLPGLQVEPCVFCDTVCSPVAMAGGQQELISLHGPTSSWHRGVLFL